MDSSSSSLAWATLHPDHLSAASPAKAQNLVNGEWKDTAKYEQLLDPLNGDKFLLVPDTQI